MRKDRTGLRTRETLDADVGNRESRRTLSKRQAPRRVAANLETVGIDKTISLFDGRAGAPRAAFRGEARTGRAKNFCKVTKIRCQKGRNGGPIGLRKRFPRGVMVETSHAAQEAAESVNGADQSRPPSFAHNLPMSFTVT